MTSAAPSVLPFAPSPSDGAVSRIGRMRNWRGRLSLSTLLALGLGTLMLVAVGSASLISFGGATRNTFALLQDKAGLILAVLEQRVRQHLDPVTAQANYLRTMIETGALDTNDAQTLLIALRAALAPTPQVAGMTFVRGQDLVAVRVSREEEGTHQENWSDRPEIQRLVASAREGGAGGWLAPVWSQTIQQTIIPLVMPVRRNGQLLGLLIPTIYSRELSAYMARFSTPDQAAFILYGRDRVLAHSSLASGDPGGSLQRPLPSLEASGDPVLSRMWSAEREGLGIGPRKSNDHGHVVVSGDEYWVYLYRPVTEYGEVPWIVGAALPERAVGRELDRLFWIGLSTLALLVLAVGLAVLLGRCIAKPVVDLVRLAEGVRRLDLRGIPALPRSRVRELDAAGQALNSVIGALRWFELYLPKRLVHRLLAQGENGMAARERDVTVMFTDIRGFSRLASRLEPKQAAAFLNDHFGLLGARIEAEDGTIDKYIGDSVMAFWGAPDDQPDHAERACRAARAIAAALHEDNARRRAEGLDEVCIRIGIATGRVLVGNIGAPGRVNYTLVGDVVTLAQRLEQLGKEVDGAGEVVTLLTEDSHACLEGNPDAVSIGRRKLRNRDGDVGVYRLA
ncbi:MAG: Adenylate cyclase [uncultured Microvirga sp.]|uniref:Adenylate cyclase n=1 Tax=uncultured Microvirga sp. TaxID=412392 RepID=A0A6J4L9G8_9HYPH|nr:MAG: Adenylate cyclase [uncultured Microvirga sp.]